MENKTNDNQINEKSITSALLPSILCIVLCVLCLCASSWAWFIDKEESEKSTLRAGRFNVTVNVKKGDVTIDLTDNSAVFSEGSYKVEITSVSTAGGYVVVSASDNYYTQRMAPGDVIQFDFTITEEKTIGFMPMLGFVPEEMKMIRTDTTNEF